MTDAKSAHEVEALILEFQNSGMRELHVRCDGFELYLSTDGNAPGIDAAGEAAALGSDRGTVARSESPGPAAPAPAPAHAPAPVVSLEEVPDGAILVRAPYMGTFYRSPKPGAPVFVDLGSPVAADTEMCLVEVMKLFTAVRAGIAGRVHAILATDGQMVAADQPLFAVVPD